MKKLWQTALWLMTFSCLLTTAAFADVIAAPMMALVLGGPLLILALVIVVITMIIRTVRRRKTKDTCERPGESAPACREDKGAK